MSKDTTNKQKNIDDALMSIDSLLDTASDVEPVDSNEDKQNAAQKASAAVTTTRQTSRSKRIAKPAAGPGAAKKHPAKSRAYSSRNKPPAGNQSTADAVGQAKQANPEQPILKTDKQSSGKRTRTTGASGGDRMDTFEEKKAEKQAGNAESRKNELDDSAAPEGTSNGDSPGSLNFTTVDDDLSQVMRELPVLEDIVTEEDLAFIGSGKEPPKKILTEAFKRLSVTDKLIQIMQNQLSDYNISKLEYQYLHELFEELLNKENKKR